MAVLIFSGRANSQTTEPAVNRHELNRIALRHLADGDVPKAFNALEAAGEAVSMISMTEPDPLAPACAGLHRALSQLSSEEQFELLSAWSIPAGANRIRVLTAIVPTGAPPKEFARVLGERPRASSFPVSSIGHVHGVYCSAWSLVVAARDSGRLKRLITDLIPLVEKKIPRAELLLMLAQIAEGREDVVRLKEELTQRAGQLKAAIPTTAKGPDSLDPSLIVLAAACLQHQGLKPMGEEMFESLLACTYAQTARVLRPFLRQAHATAILVNRGESDPSQVLMPRFKYWLPASGELTGSNALWMAHEDHVLHLSGSGYDQLHCRYPLLGTFQFHADTQSGGRFETEGGLVYGGLHFQPLSGVFAVHVSNSQGTQLGKRFCYYVFPGVRPTYHHLSLDISHAATLSVNRHTMWHDPDAADGPWLALRSLDERNPIFRNLTLTGNPVIPRSVSLSTGDTLRGWQNLIDGVPHVAEGSATWRMSENTIEASAGTDEANTPVEHLLSFQRPLAVGESISYEFLHVPGKMEVSPALGRVVFLLQPDGVRLHWMTNGSQEWTGLAPDNSLVEPLNRRGTRLLPLRANDWNRITLTRSEQSVTLSLNDVAIYERVVDWAGDHRFGFYRHRAAAGARVRNVKLSGDWPETIPQEFHQNPLATVGPALPAEDRQTIDRLFGDDFLSENIFAIRRRALAMPLADRWEFLSRWVLPGPDHAGFRVTGDFTPTRPAPIARQPATVQPELGGEIVSPVYDWLDAARELGRLSECRRLVEAAPIDDGETLAGAKEFQARARAALLMLISIEQGDTASTNSDGEKLFDLLKTQTPVEIRDQWPETLVVDRGFNKMPRSAGVQEIESQIYSQRVLRWQPEGIGVWHTHLAAIHGRMKLLKSRAAETSSPELSEWISVVVSRSICSGGGFPNAIWHRDGTQVTKVAGHDEDFLFYRQPLSGNFEVECDVVEPSHAATQILLAGTFSGICWDLKNLDVGTVRGAAPKFPLERPLTIQGPWVRYRSVIRDGRRMDYMNGQLVRNLPVPEHADPWVGVRVWGRFQSKFQNVRITGHPTVLDAVPLSDSKDLTGWSSYHDEPIATAEGGWKLIEDPDKGNLIVGRRDPGLAGNYHEGLLRYQRPLVEDGTVDYEFFYEPGVMEVHPALDRLALLLNPSGVREHWITDHRYERTELAPDNSFERMEARRGPAELPLKPRDWNHVKLTLRRTTLTIDLNDQRIYERPLEATNQRTFGLFRYVDIGEARVRNAVMRGDWRKSLRSLADQELAGPVNPLDADLPRLAARFTHDFEKDGLPIEYFKPLSPGNGVSISPRREGLRVNVAATGVWTSTEIIPRFGLAGDFDIEAAFANLQVNVQKRDAGIILMTTLDDARKSVYGVSRVLNEAGFQGTQCSESLAHADGARSWRAEVVPNAAVNGRLRLARRGTTLSYLFAEEDSQIFRTFHTETIPDTATEPEGARLHSLCTVAGTSNVIWKKLDLRAERMTWLRENAESSTLMLRVVDADGKRLKTIATPTSIGLTHLGSPEWSPDGRKIALDMSNGSTSSSRIVVLNADGTELKDIGPGCMPSFSRDGSRVVLSLPGEGVVTMTADGKDRQVIDRSAWGSQWSPDGKSIAYIKSGNITVLDLESRESRTLLMAESATRYSYLYWALGWSNDNRYIGFKGRRRDNGKSELGVVDVASGEFTMLHSDAATVIEDFAWSPDNEQLIVSIHDPSIQGPQLFAIDRKNPGPPQLLPAQPKNLKSCGHAWSRDGKTIAIASMRVPVPIKWITGPVEESE